MTMSKQAQKTLSENTEKTFSANMPPFSSKGGGGIIAEISVQNTTREKMKRIFKETPTLKDFEERRGGSCVGA